MKKEVKMVWPDQVEFPEPNHQMLKKLSFEDQVGFFPDISSKPKTKIKGKLSRKTSEDLFCEIVDLGIDF